MPVGTGTVCLPLGPSTFRCPSPIASFTPFGSGIGFFPTRDIFSFPYFATRFFNRLDQTSNRDHFLTVPRSARGASQKGPEALTRRGRGLRLRRLLCARSIRS